jgi:ATP-binding cassette subfamily B protein
MCEGAVGFVYADGCFPPERRRSMQKKQNRLLFRLVTSNTRTYLGAVVCTVFSVLINFITPLLLAETVDSILGTEPSRLPAFLQGFSATLGGRENLVRNLWIVGLILVSLNVVNGIFTYFKGRWSAVASENIALTIRDRLYTHLQHMPFSYHVKAETGDLIQRCTSDVETVRRFLSVQLVEAVNTILMLTMAFSILWSLQYEITLYSMIMIPILFLTAFIFFKKITTHFRHADESEGKMSAVLQENLTGVRVVRAFGRQQHEVEKFDAASEDYRGKVFKLIRMLSVYWSSADLLSMLQIMATLLLCIWYAAEGIITVGTMIIFTSFVGMLLFPVRQLGRILSDAGKTKVSMQRIREILDNPVEAPEPDAVRPPLDGDVVFDDVVFAYDESRPILNHLSCTIKAGDTVAILGSTGSGKSTMVHLLQRLFEPQSGSILIGGVPISIIDRKYLRSHVGLILQEPFLFSKTIRENVGIALPSPSQEEIERVASIACANGFIQESEKGYDTLVGERGVTLSGGQKQRIAIARTLMKENDILIFDDSLSAVDTETDAQIRAALRLRSHKSTTIIISHRITTLSEADHILVLDQGRVVDQGTHQELCSHPGLYQRINQIQTALEEEFTLSQAKVKAEVM